jgi:hypothetical protein
LRSGAAPGSPGVSTASQSSGTQFNRSDALDGQAARFRDGAGRYPNINAAGLAGYANAWHPANVVGASLYTHPGYSGLARGLGLAAVPVAYDYGGNVVASPSAVYVNGDSAGTPQQYAQQASEIASAGQSAQPAAESKWLPLGVFAIVEGDATTSDDIFQLAVNPEGVLRGNYRNVRTDQVEAISGSVDKKTQRTAWTIGTDQTPVYEAGLANLTKDSTPILVQNAEGQPHQMLLLRVPQPEQQTAGAGAAPSSQQ